MPSDLYKVPSLISSEYHSGAKMYEEKSTLFDESTLYNPKGHEKSSYAQQSYSAKGKSLPINLF